MKESWEIKKLGEVCELKSGTTISPSLERNEGDVLYTKVADMNLPENLVEINTSSRFVNIADINQKQIIPEGAIIFPKRGGAIATNKKRKIIKPTIVDLNTMAIIPSKKINKDYFFHWFQLFDLNDISNGANIPQINNYSFDEVYIPFPKSLPEQQRIVSILDEAFAAIAKAKANAEQNLRNSKELFESYLQGVFEKKGDGWEEKMIGDVFQMRPQKSEVKNKLQDNDYVTFLPMEDLGIGQIEVSGVKRKELKDVYSGYTYFSENDVLLAKITPCFENGKLGIARNLVNGVGFGSSEYFVFRAKGTVLSEYLYYFLSQNEIKEGGKKSMGGAVGHQRVSKEWIEAFLIPYPKSLAEQQKIISQLEDLRAGIKKLEAIYQQKINDLEELKKSILQKAFSGELKTEKLIEI